MMANISQLDNGIQVLTQNMAHLETVALGVWIKAGARDETEAQNGVAHLLEHMAFKGTGRRSASDIAIEIESAGGDINAGTSMENTAYYARVLRQDWPMALDILSDIVLNPRFDPVDLKQEQQVILQEIAAANDTPDDLVFEMAQQAAFRDQSLGRSILGQPEKVAGFNAQDIAGYRNDHYSGGRIVVAAAGCVDHAAFLNEVGEVFAAVPARDEISRDAAAFTGGFERIDRPLDQAHLVFGFPACGYRDPDIYKVQLLSSVLGGGMSSRLFQTVREQRGLCYTVFAHPVAYSDTGMVQVYAASAPETVNELAHVMSDVMLTLEQDVEEAELDRAKAQLKAGLVMSLESASARADQIARQFLGFGEVLDIAEIIRKIDAVTSEEVREMAARTFRTRTPVISAVGALDGLAHHDELAARFY